MAVGTGRSGSCRHLYCTHTSFAEHWNGARWTAMQTEFRAVECGVPESDELFGVGRSGVEHWDGTAGRS